MYKILHDNCLNFLERTTDKFDLVYIDPPFNTGKKQKTKECFYEDKFNDYLGFMEEVVKRISNVLSDTGSLFIHLDWHEVHYIKVMTDKFFGRSNFKNEIVWSYDYGARQKDKWATKHDNILWYVKDINKYTFNYDAIDRIPYLAPTLVGAEKAERGKTPTDVWWNTVVPTNGSERVGYPTQKPLSIVQRIVDVHSNQGDLMLDCFAGSGTFGEAALNRGRDVILVDANHQAVDIMQKRLSKFSNIQEDVDL